jgi:voltage-gated potassium channel
MKWHEKGILLVVLYSLAMFFVELSYGSQNSLSGPVFFLWSERTVAGVLTLEIALRFWFHSPHTATGTDRAYFRSPEMVFDMVSVMPFWIGFLITDPEGLAVVRSMRVLRLLKFYRASPVAHMVMESLISQRRKIRLVTFVVTITVLFAGVSMYHLEGPSQPDTFGTMWGSVWWAVVTMTTVGYGDMSPATFPGQMVASLIMITSIGIVGALIGIISSAFNAAEDAPNEQSR